MVGTFLEVGASACVTCTVGQYSADGTGGADCIACVVGRYISVTGSDEASDCIDCVAGKFSLDAAGAAECSACHGFGAAASIATGSCTDCADASASACRAAACAPGYHSYYAPTYQQVSQDGCAANSAGHTGWLGVQSAASCANTCHGLSKLYFTVAVADSNCFCSNECIDENRGDAFSSYMLPSSHGPHCTAVGTDAGAAACGRSVDFREDATVADGSCAACTDGTRAACARAACAPGHHSYRGASGLAQHAASTGCVPLGSDAGAAACAASADFGAVASVVNGSCVACANASVGECTVNFSLLAVFPPECTGQLASFGPT